MFTPRKTFVDTVKATWYPGHMSTAMRDIRGLLNSTDMVLEIRIPLSSRNPQFASFLTGKPHLVIYNKTDLSRIDTSIVRKWDPTNRVLFQNSKSTNSVSQLLRAIRPMVKESALSVKGVRVLVIGMPNVGKSTILNALRHVSLRKGKAARTGAQPGITRSTSSIIKIIDDPVVYFIDTPGIMVPFVPNTETFLKLALVNSIKENIVDPITLADYLLFVLNLQEDAMYPALYDITQTNDVHELLDGIAKKKGKLKKGGQSDIDGAAKLFIHLYRSGVFGAFCLDNVFDGALQERIDEEGRYLSKSQIRQGIQAKK